MSVVEVTSILDRNLTVDEKAKFNQVKDGLADIFAKAGHVVRVCEATGDGDRRRIGFIASQVGNPRISIAAADFLASSDLALKAALKSCVEETTQRAGIVNPPGPSPAPQPDSGGQRAEVESRHD
jgi:ABC-type antimicrobial peptide transport system ATPase subunit